jgi:hypothetical protein
MREILYTCDFMFWVCVSSSVLDVGYSRGQVSHFKKVGEQPVLQVTILCSIRL